MTTTEADFLQSQVDVLTAENATQALEIGNLQANEAALTTALITQGQRTTALETAAVPPAQGQVVDIGITYEGRDVKAHGVGQSAYGGVPANGERVIPGASVWQIVEVDVIVHLIGPGGVSYQTPLPWADFDGQPRWVTVEADTNTGQLAVVGNVPAGWAIQNWWGSIGYTER